MVGYTVRNLVLRQGASWAVNRDFRTYIRQYTSSSENFEYGNPHSNALLQFRLELEHLKPHKAAHHPKRCDVINDIKLISTISQDILWQIFDVIQSDVVLQNQVH